MAGCVAAGWTTGLNGPGIVNVESDLHRKLAEAAAKGGPRFDFSGLDRLFTLSAPLPQHSTRPADLPRAG